MPEALWRYGQTAYLLGDYPSADRMLSRAAAYFSNQSGPFYYLGLTHLKEGKSTEAIEALRSAREIDPHNLEIFNALAGPWNRGMVKEPSGNSWRRPT